MRSRLACSRIPFAIIEVEDQSQKILVAASRLFQSEVTCGSWTAVTSPDLLLFTEPHFEGRLRNGLSRFLVTPMHAIHNDRLESSRRQAEIAARTALEVRIGRALTDLQWEAVRYRLLEFVNTLRTWDSTQSPAESNI